jgi:hypothetical protein
MLGKPAQARLPAQHICYASQCCLKLTPSVLTLGLPYQAQPAGLKGSKLHREAAANAIYKLGTEDAVHAVQRPIS